MKRLLSIGIILLFIGMSISSSTGKLEITSFEDVQNKGIFFGLKSNLEISWDDNETKEPIIPRGPIRYVELNISFWNTWGIFGRLIPYFYSGKLIFLNMMVTDIPEWCSAVLHTNFLSFNIPSKEYEKHTRYNILGVWVWDDAPAFELFNVTIKATIKSIRGPFGLLKILHGINHFENISFRPAYKPLLNIFLPEGNTIESPPLVKVELPIELENLGNGKTNVEIEIVDYPIYWNVSIQSQLILEVDEKKEISLNITSPSNFSGTQSIKLSFTPHYYYNYSLMGVTIYDTFIAYYYPP